MIEAGFGWLPALGLAARQALERLRDEVPHLKRLPSEYIREHVWLTTQPMEEPESREHLLEVIELDRLGQAVVRDRLPALGFRRAVARAAAGRQRRATARRSISATRRSFTDCADGASRRRPGGRIAAGDAKNPRHRRPADRDLQRQGRVLRPARTAARTRARRCARGR